ncbi:hypothetical protein HDV05_005168 [Chytridiales sp. JEL 0842]|nr:hypothetical protein HDV05_005168 [Chytridiales sp. JEL 0842]
MQSITPQLPKDSLDPSLSGSSSTTSPSSPALLKPSSATMQQQPEQPLDENTALNLALEFDFESGPSFMPTLTNYSTTTTVPMSPNDQEGTCSPCSPDSLKDGQVVSHSLERTPDLMLDMPHLRHPTNDEEEEDTQGFPYEEMEDIDERMQDMFDYEKEEESNQDTLPAPQLSQKDTPTLLSTLPFENLAESLMVKDDTPIIESPIGNMMFESRSVMDERKQALLQAGVMEGEMGSGSVQSESAEEGERALWENVESPRDVEVKGKPMSLNSPKPPVSQPDFSKRKLEPKLLSALSPSVKAGGKPSAQKPQVSFIKTLTHPSQGSSNHSKSSSPVTKSKLPSASPSFQKQKSKVVPLSICTFNSYLIPSILVSNSNTTASTDISASSAPTSYYSPSKHNLPSSSTSSSHAYPPSKPNHQRSHTSTPSFSLSTFSTAATLTTQPNSNITKLRADRIADFCRTMHVVLLQEVWGPGVDTLTTSLAHTHGIPPALKSTKVPYLTETWNTLAFFLTGTCGLWVAYSKVPEWEGGDRVGTDGIYSTSALDPGDGVDHAYRYPPIKRPGPHVSLFPIPLTVPTNDPVKRKTQLKEIAMFVYDVVLSLASLPPPTHFSTASEGRSSGISATSPVSFKAKPQSSPILEDDDDEDYGDDDYSEEEDDDDDDEYSDEDEEDEEGINCAAYPAEHHSRTLGKQAATNRGHEMGDEGSLDEFEVVEDLISKVNRIGAPATSPRVLPSSNATSLKSTSTGPDQLQQHPLPAHSLANLKSVCSQTAVLIAGDLNIEAGTAEFQTNVLNLFGSKSSRLFDYFADSNSSVDSSSSPRKNRRASTISLDPRGAVRGRVDHILGLHKLLVNVVDHHTGQAKAGEVVEFMRLRRIPKEENDDEVDGGGAGYEDDEEEGYEDVHDSGNGSSPVSMMSGHHPVVGWFTPA